MADKRDNPTWIHFRGVVLTRMRKLDLRQYQLAKLVGISPSSMVGLLREGSIPRGTTLMNLSRVLGLDPNELVPGTGRTAPQKGEESDERLTGGRLVLAELDDLLRQLKARWEGRAERARAAEEHYQALEQHRQKAPRKRQSRGS